jgi:hypothetical protein
VVNKELEYIITARKHGRVGKKLDVMGYGVWK